MGRTLLAPAASAATDYVQKSYVDALVAGLSPKSACRVATAAALPANTYLAGVLTGTGNGALTVDGTAVAAGDRVLVKDEATQANNGIYVVTATGGIAAVYVLTRSSDMNEAAEIPGAYTVVEIGTANAGTAWVVASSGPFVVGTTAIVWTEFGGPAILKSLVTAKGDLIVATASGVVTNLVVGTNGLTAMADSSASSGLSYGAPYRPTNAQSGDYTLVLADKDKFIKITKATAQVLTVPPNSSVAFPTDTEIPGVQYGAGQVTVTPGAGVTINGVPGLKTAAQYGPFCLKKIGTDEWLLIGRLAA